MCMYVCMYVGTLMTGQNPASAAPLGDAIVKYFAAK